MRRAAILFWGKLRRFYLHILRPGYIRENHARRQGDCKRCGACCKLGHRCPWLKTDGNGLAFCKGYSWRPKNCRVFPIDERDIADRNLVLPDVPCGYTFAKKE